MMADIEKSAREIIIKTYMRRGGLTDWDREYVEADVDAILRTLKRKGFHFTAQKQ